MKLYSGNGRKPNSNLADQEVEHEEYDTLKKTETYLAFRIPAKTSEAVMGAMNALHNEYGNHSQRFLRPSRRNGSEFADELNGGPRRKLCYPTPEELFEAFLESVFAA